MCNMRQVQSKSLNMNKNFYSLHRSLNYKNTPSFKPGSPRISAKISEFKASLTKYFVHKKYIVHLKGHNLPTAEYSRLYFIEFCSTTNIKLDVSC